MTRTTKIISGTVLALVALVAIAIILFLNYDWNRARPWLNTRVSDAIGRPFSINGNLALTWEKPPTRLPGWRNYIPWPHLSGEDIRIANPDWAKSAPYMTQIQRVHFSLNPLPLLDKKISIPALELEAPSVALERLSATQNNWTFKTSDTPSEWKLALDEIVFAKGVVKLKDAVKHADITANIDTLDDKQAAASGNLYGIGWTLSGSLNQEKVGGNGKAGGVLSLQKLNSPFPLEADMQIGKSVKVQIKGTLTNPSDLAAVDMRLHLAGSSMAKLYALTGVVLPETPPFSTEGHLTGRPNRSGGNWVYDKFTGKVGSSDLAGTLEYTSQQNGAPLARPLLSGALVSRLLQFDDLGPLIGADSNASKQNRGAAPVQPSDKVLPVEQFNTERWGSMDADIKFTGNKIIRSKDLPIDNLVTNVHLKDSVISLTPLNFGAAGGNFSSNIKLDGRNQLIKAEMKVSARHLKLKNLFPSFEAMKASLGEINGDASLSATGSSIASLLGNSNGEVKALINQGSISKLLLEEMGLNIGNIVLTQLSGDKQIEINCLASDFAVTNGVMQTRTFVVDTQESITNVDGQVNLSKEQLDLKINPHSKGLRLISLRTPLYVTGSFKNPKLSLDKGVLAMKAGGAVALAVLAPIAALVPLVTVGPGRDSPCASLLAEAGSKPVAPPPGKTRTDKPTRK
ncbi:AsmA family protein [Undibacterium sp. TJN25]|uniref:AsmA family protein n=1 Tax=Undibacterium sp. TJN25 TaxID=3413056 RepID=UPI003BEFAA10